MLPILQQRLLKLFIICAVCTAHAMEKAPVALHLELGKQLGTLPVLKEDTPFYQAISSGNVSILRQHLEKLRQVSASTTWNLNDYAKDVCIVGGFLPLHWVLDDSLAMDFYTRKEMLTVLLQAGAFIGAVNNDGKTVVHEAALSDSSDMQKLFLFLYEQEMASDLINIDGQTVLHAAVIQGLPDKVRYLLSLKKHELEVRDIQNRTPLQAVFDVSLPARIKTVIAHELIQAGANVSVRDVHGVPLLFDLINKVDLSGVRVLLSHGADWSIADWQGISAIDFAQEKIAKTEKPEAAKTIYALLQEYAQGKQMPQFLPIAARSSAAASYASIMVPPSLQSHIDIARFKQELCAVLTAVQPDGSTLLQRALINSYNEEQHEN